MSLAGKFAASAAASATSTTRFTTGLTRAAVRANSAAAVAPTVQGEQSSYRGKSTAFTAGSSTTSYTTSPTLFKQQRFMSGFAAGPGSQKVPSFADYTKERSQDSSRAFTYFMLGASGAVLTTAAQSSVHGFLTNMAASADVLAMATTEVDMSTIPVGKTVTI
ncbi:ubiquinol--cytochrome-c reductase catalytic subunit rip1, partial [Kickxella alabastrina]